ncbi:MAG: TIGR03986 family CRISPR-associated RAMP protein [Defluviicoccus sp.]
MSSNHWRQNGRGQPHEKPDAQDLTVPSPPPPIHAPYNWVPLSRMILKPDWADRVTHDFPFSDGVSGSLTLKIKAHTPILVAGEQKKTKGQPGEARFFQLPDKTYAIPGSALRGMIRSVIEIAGFGAMSAVDDRRIAIRDLTPAARAIYGSRLTKEVGRTPEDMPIYEPRSRAGWLKFDRETKQWQLTPCRFARVEHSELSKVKLSTVIQWAKRSSARQRYKDWKNFGGTLQAIMNVEEEKEHRHQNGNILIRYQKAIFGGSQEGTLVFTGNTGVKKNFKHMEFFFFAREKNSLPLDSKCMDSFLAIHGDDDGDWKCYWQQRIKAKQEVPIFWLEGTDGHPADLGLSMMFKLPHGKTIHGTIANTNPEHIRSEAPDLATLLFGTASDDEDHVPGLKGRVSFGLALAQNDPKPMKAQLTVLNGPKPSYSPNYVRQPTKGEPAWKLKGETYATYTALSGPNLAEELTRPEVRGWKRYPVRREDEVKLQSVGQAGPDVQVSLHPLPKDTVFVGEVRFHNLRAVELGALLWALEWGGNENLRHALGMNKAAGYGQVSIEVVRSTWSAIIANDPIAQVKHFCQYVKDFVDYMNDKYREKANKSSVDWQRSEQIVQLLAMANPYLLADQKSYPGELRHMLLRTKPNLVNQFLIAKNNRCVLAEYAMFDGIRDRDIFSLSGRHGNRGSTPVPPSANQSRSEPPEAWLKRHVSFVAKRSFGGDDNRALLSQMLAGLWKQIAEPELQARVREIIIGDWQQRGAWQSPPDDDARAAQRIYGQS